MSASQSSESTSDDMAKAIAQHGHPSRFEKWPGLKDDHRSLRDDLPAPCSTREYREALFKALQSYG